MGRTTGIWPTTAAVMVVAAVMGMSLSACVRATVSTDHGAEPISAVVECMGTEINVTVLDTATPITALSEEASGALDGLDVPELDPAAWIVVTDSADLVVLIRELEDPDTSVGDLVRTHELLSISTENSALPADDPWMLVGATSCPLTTPMGELSSAAVALDPENPAGPADRTLALLVTEMACNSGQGAEGRVELVSLVESADSVEFVVGVRPTNEPATCPSNPPTPFVIELASPLGDRQILNGGLFPAAPMETTTGK